MGSQDKSRPTRTTHTQHIKELSTVKRCLVYQQQSEISFLMIPSSNPLGTILTQSEKRCIKNLVKCGKNLMMISGTWPACPTTSCLMIPQAVTLRWRCHPHLSHHQNRRSLQAMSHQTTE